MAGVSTTTALDGRCADCFGVCSPEFNQSGEQKYLFSGVVVAMLLGYWLETGRLEGLAKSGKRKL